MVRSRSGANSLAFNLYDNLAPIVWFDKLCIACTSPIALFYNKNDWDARSYWVTSYYLVFFALLRITLY